MTTNPKDSADVDAMRCDWNERARKNAFLYIASWNKDWDEASFFASGEVDYQNLVAPVLERLAFDPSDKAMAEIGCGVGRMTRSFARQFRTVFAVDISDEMQIRAKTLLSKCSNVIWILSEGQSLAGLSSNSLDFVFSYLVLQHFPSTELVAGAIQEMIRTLKPGGVYLFQFNSFLRPNMNWKGRLLCSCLDWLASIGLKPVSRLCAHLVGIDPHMVGRTWRGVALTSSEIDRMVREAGGPSPAFLAENTPFAWCYGQKI